MRSSTDINSQGRKYTMTRKHVAGLFAGLVLMALASGTNAQLQSSKLGLQSVSFEDQRREILAKLDDGESYVELAAADRQQVVAALTRMQRVYESSAGSRPNEIQRVALFNDGEVVNSLLGQARADSRLVCERVHSTGSRRIQRSCQTVAQRERSRREAEDYLRVRLPDVDPKEP